MRDIHMIRKLVALPKPKRVRKEFSRSNFSRSSPQKPLNDVERNGRRERFKIGHEDVLGASQIVQLLFELSEEHSEHCKVRKHFQRVLGWNNEYERNGRTIRLKIGHEYFLGARQIGQLLFELSEEHSDHCTVRKHFQRVRGWKKARQHR